MAETLKSGGHDSCLVLSDICELREESSGLVGFDDRVEVHKKDLEIFGSLIQQTSEAPGIRLTQVSES